MKKLVLLFIGMAAFAFASHAQSLHIGVKGGANLGKIDGQSFNDGFKLGYQLGGFAEIDFSKSLGIQPEVLFSQTNTKTASTASDVTNGIITNDNKSLNYLSIPVLLRINAGNLLTFHVGPQFSVLLNNHETVLENGKDAFKSGDFAAVLGAQVNLGTFRVYGRYNIGLSNISDIDNSGKWKNQQIQLGVGIKLL
ncbi:porin family protein [Deminuibacter soli]|uniref:PorT family protein n=1 Tax=Deminuibacter soli TaxID=2291815 RepID=A0A3E1NLP9_9BACT|nr:porin family protein [Deminuibacter soli]RFM28774.1 PorT family protein [Deminuibacter soli]